MYLLQRKAGERKMTRMEKMQKEFGKGFSHSLEWHNLVLYFLDVIIFNYDTKNPKRNLRSPGMIRKAVVHAASQKICDERGVGDSDARSSTLRVPIASEPTSSWGKREWKVVFHLWIIVIGICQWLRLLCWRLGFSLYVIHVWCECQSAFGFRQFVGTVCPQ